MKKSKHFITFVLFISLTFCSYNLSGAGPLGTAFTYEGRLIDTNGPAEGFYDFEFTLYDAQDPNTRTQCGNIIDMNNLEVVNGYFIVDLDFGNGDPNVFNGNARWLETLAWPSGNIANSLNIMHIMQEITAVPYSLLSRGIFVDKNRYVGIGTSNPSDLLHVAGLARFDLGQGRIHMSTPGGWPGMIAFSPNGHRRDIIFDDGSIRLLTSGSSSPAPSVNGICINENGYVGIGASPFAPLDVRKESSGSNIVVGYFSNPSDAAGSQVSIDLNVGSGMPTAWRITGTGSDLRIGNAVAATPAVTITGSGKMGIGTTDPGNYNLAVDGSAAKPGGGYWSTLSDIRLKNINENFNRGLNEVSMLRPVRYEYKENNELQLPTESEFVGVISQEVQDVIPEAVEQNDNGYFMVNNEPIFWAMVNAIKELKEENEILKEKVEALEKSYSSR